MKVLLLFVLFLSSFALKAQSYELETLITYPLQADRFVGVDDYGSTYYTVDRTLKKILVDKTEHQFAALQLGTITTVDILNPLKITVFYRDSNTVVILDNTLSEINRINFSTISNFRNVGHASTANDRRLWIFNTDLQQMEVFDYNSDKVVVQFPPLSTLGNIQVSDFNFCWLAMDSILLKYNIYGSLLEKHDIQNIENISVDDGNLLYTAKDQLFFKSKNSNQFSAIKNLEIPIKQFSLNNEILYIYDGQKVTSFRLKLAKE